MFLEIKHDFGIAQFKERLFPISQLVLFVNVGYRDIVLTRVPDHSFQVLIFVSQMEN